MPTDPPLFWSCNHNQKKRKIFGLGHGRTLTGIVICGSSARRRGRCTVLTHAAFVGGSLGHGGLFATIVGSRITPIITIRTYKIIIS